MALNFPLKSTEFIFGSPQYNDYIQALDKVKDLYTRAMDLRYLDASLCF